MAFICHARNLPTGLPSTDPGPKRRQPLCARGFRGGPSLPMPPMTGFHQVELRGGSIHTQSSPPQTCVVTLPLVTLRRQGEGPELLAE